MVQRYNYSTLPSSANEHGNVTTLFAIGLPVTTYGGILLFTKIRILPDMPQSGKKKPSRSKIRQIWRTSFYINGFVTLRTVALRRPIFEHKEGCSTIDLGLNYCSMGSYQPPSRETIPLIKIQCPTHWWSLLIETSTPLIVSHCSNSAKGCC
jgi:hypothetical protein